VKWIALSWIVLVLAGVGPFMPWARRPLPRLAATLACLAALTLSLAYLVGSAIEPHFTADDKTIVLQ
jgi:hypothetical protein